VTRAVARIGVTVAGIVSVRSWWRDERASPAMTLDVVISDQDPVSGHRLARRLEGEAVDIEVLAVCGHAEVVVRMTEYLPDLLLLVAPTDAETLDRVRPLRVRCPSTSIVLVAPASAAEAVYPLLRAGVASVMEPPAPMADHDVAMLVAAMRDAMAGRVPLPREMAKWVVRDLEAFEPARLNPVERQVIDAVGAGANPAETAAALGIDEVTVWRQIRGIRTKLEVTDRVRVQKRQRRGPTRFASADVLLDQTDGPSARTVASSAGGSGTGTAVDGPG
jgi:DNA-binding NarL/FixJ family response regulator